MPYYNTNMCTHLTSYQNWSYLVVAIIIIIITIIITIVLVIIIVTILMMTNIIVIIIIVAIVVVVIIITTIIIITTTIIADGHFPRPDSPHVATPMFSSADGHIRRGNCCLACCQNPQKSGRREFSNIAGFTLCLYDRRTKHLDVLKTDLFSSILVWLWLPKGCRDVSVSFTFQAIPKCSHYAAVIQPGPAGKSPVHRYWLVSSKMEIFPSQPWVAYQKVPTSDRFNSIFSSRRRSPSSHLCLRKHLRLVRHPQSLWPSCRCWCRPRWRPADDGNYKCIRSVKLSFFFYGVTLW